MPTATNRPFYRRRWWMPAFSVFLGLLLVIIGVWLYEVAQGEDGSPCYQLCAVGGLAYILAVAYMRWRS